MAIKASRGLEVCGIAGFVTTVPSAWAEMVAHASSMATALTHRGPDGDGFWGDPEAGVALAHRRLAVLDLSDNGAQPMVSGDGRYVLIYNGEIYNHRELGDRLAEDGFRGRGHSDTEILLETIARTSLERALELCNGMFALALWDRRNRTLTLARDRLGEKPLYYAWTGRRLLFGSELTALQAHPGFEGRIDQESVAAFLRRGFVPGARTVYQDVFKLPPGHLLRVDPELNRCPEPQPYWSLASVVRSGRDLRGELLADEDLVDRAAELLQAAVARRMVADVPLGAFLSGGVDSSLVVAMMQRATAQSVRTFTVAVGGQYDESDQAASVARVLGTDHTTLDLTERDALSLAIQIPTLYDEPFGDPSAIPCALMSAAARQHVTVCLTGDGGDEMLAGYNRYLAAAWPLDVLGRLPQSARERLARTLMRTSPGRFDTIGRRVPAIRHIPDIGTKIHKLAQMLEAGNARTAYGRLAGVLDPRTLMRSYEPSVDPPPEAWLEELDDLHYMLYMDGSVTLPDDMLVKVDRASMAASLECRVPLLDHDFVEFVWGLPARAKLRGRRGKWLLRQLLLRDLPAEMVDRPKHGFDPPMALWLRGPLREWSGDLLARDRLVAQNILDPSAVSRLWHEHMSGAKNHDYRLWALVVFQAWLSGRAAESPPSTTLPASTTAVKSST